MRLNQIKFFSAAIIVLPLILLTVSSTNPVGAVSAVGDDAGVDYKKNACFACHKGDASKFFDPEKTDEHHVQAILKGVKGEKPPYMPAYEKKGMTEEKAAALVAHMRKLREPEPEPGK